MLLSGAIEILRKEPYLAAGLGVWSAAILSYLTKDIPKRIYSFVRRQFIVSVEILSQEETFAHVTKMIEKINSNKKFRKLRVNRAHLIVGYGRQYFIYKRRFWWIDFSRIENTGDRIYEEIRISCYGRNQAIIREFLSEAKSEFNKSTKTKVYKASYKGWSFLCQQESRKMETLILQKNIKEKVLNHLNYFIESRDWYFKNGIPYRTGICLYGPPGTGKTSLVRALAGHFNMPIYTLDLATLDLDSLSFCFSSLPPKSIILIEDIDTCGMKKRDMEGSGKIENIDSENNNKINDGLNSRLGSLLNSIDGIVESNGHVLIMTTNQIDKLDYALIRPGRVDLKIELGYLTDETFRKSFASFYPHFVLPEDIEWNERISPAHFQAMVLENRKHPEKVFEAVIKPREMMNHGLMALEIG